MPDERQTAVKSAPAALVDEWADRAMACAAATMVDADPPRWVAKIEGAVGALGFGDTEQESLEDLRSGLPGWAAMKLELGAVDGGAIIGTADEAVGVGTATVVRWWAAADRGSEALSSGEMRGGLDVVVCHRATEWALAAAPDAQELAALVGDATGAGPDCTGGGDG